MTQVIAIPLRDREADALRDQLAITPGVDQAAGARWSRSARSAWCSPARRATAAGCWPGR